MRFIKKILLFISETFFPADYFTKKLEKMSAGEFICETQGLSEAREINPHTKQMFGVGVNGLYILFEYHNPLVLHAIRALKFKGNEPIAKLLAKVLYENIVEELADKACFENFIAPILIPMPSSNERKRTRGWNQCELLAQELARLDNSSNFVVDTKILSKNKFTETQVGKTRAERLANLAGSFSARDARKIAGRNIILLDDVVTTGATMSEAKKTLLNAGVRKVWCIALAH